MNGEASPGLNGKVRPHDELSKRLSHLVARRPGLSGPAGFAKRCRPLEDGEAVARGGRGPADQLEAEPYLTLTLAALSDWNQCCKSCIAICGSWLACASTETPACDSTWLRDSWLVSSATSTSRMRELAADRLTRMV